MNRLPVKAIPEHIAGAGIQHDAELHEVDINVILKLSKTKACQQLPAVVRSRPLFIRSATMLNGAAQTICHVQGKIVCPPHFDIPRLAIQTLLKIEEKGIRRFCSVNFQILNHG
jgi:hypothetical protein